MERGGEGMTKRELKYIETILERVKDSDNKIAKALAFVRKDLACYEARKGQLQEMYDAEINQW